MNPHLLTMMQSYGDEIENYSPARGQLNVQSYAGLHNTDNTDYWLHFFIDDKRFEAIWNNPMRYLRKFQALPLAGLIGFDYSLYDDYPMILNRWNHYRNAFFTCFVSQALELPLLPVACWDGLNPQYSHWYIKPGSAVALGSYPMKGGNQAAYLQGLQNLLKTIQPSELHVFGNLPPNIHIDLPIYRYNLHYQNTFN